MSIQNVLTILQSEEIKCASLSPVVSIIFFVHLKTIFYKDEDEFWQLSIDPDISSPHINSWLQPSSEKR